MFNDCKLPMLLGATGDSTEIIKNILIWVDIKDFLVPVVDSSEVFFLGSVDLRSAEGGRAGGTSAINYYTNYINKIY